ncbi:MAG: TonB family protein [Bacteroidetes bacterium]|nr:TonB family protein [Bacteroidota bacterium]
MNMIFYLSKTILISGLLFSYYWLSLRNKIFHQYNRFYLLSIPVASICLPLMNLPIPGFEWQRQSVAIKLLDVVSSANWEEPVEITPGNNSLYNLLAWQDIACIVFMLVFLAFLIAFARNIWHIKKIASKYGHTKIDGINFYQTEEPEAPFSFLKNIFWNTNIDASTTKGKQIFRHELFHVKQNHTADILFIQLVNIVFWFNPLFHFVRKEIKTVHEFLADQYASNETNSHEYAELLVLSVAAKNHFQIAHSFFNHQLKRRIAMLTKFKKNRYGYISRLMALPLLFVLVCAFAVKLKPVKSFAKFIAPKKITVVVDAGHGGISNGTISSNGIREKDINLSIAKKIEQLGKEYNINVIMTREKDEAVGNASSLSEDLLNRTNIASLNNADAFISIHVDADITPTTEKSGFGIFIPGTINDNYQKSKILASAITEELKSVYKTDEQLKERDKGIVVLDKNSVPSIMIECGYINNKKDADFITNPLNQEKIARNILQGVAKYNDYASSINEITNVAQDKIDKIEIKNNSVIIYKTDNSIIELKRNYDGVKMNTIVIEKKFIVNVKYDNNTFYCFKKDGTTVIIILKKATDVSELHEKMNADTLPREELQKINPNNIKSMKVIKEKNIAIVYFKNGDSAMIPNIKLSKNQKSEDEGEHTKVFTKVEVEAEYPGGQAAWADYLTKNLKYPQEAVNKSIQGTVVVQFIVGLDGSLSEITASKKVSLSLDKAAINVIKESGKWVPAMQNGKQVRSFKKQPIVFRLEK